MSETKMSETAEKFLDEVQMLFSLKDDRKVTLDSRLVEDLNAASMQYFGMAATIEEMTGKSPSIDALKKCATIGDVVKLAESYKKA
ncbi:MAG: hypothetical protein ACOX6J_00360 [Oscillospiraceae bacterium]|jgi:acyl carrier protein